MADLYTLRDPTKHYPRILNPDYPTPACVTELN
jgi:hypothetical protein